MAHLVTGHAGIEHIKPSDDGAFNIGICGSGQYVFPIGEQFGYEIISNNLIKIKSGELVNQGRHINIPVNNYEELTIENGLQGVKRHDIIVMRYERNPDTNIESASLVVLKGTSSTNPNDPSMTLASIYEGANVSDMPLYRVYLDGLNIEKVECMFTVMPSLPSVNAKAEKNAEDIAAVKTKNLLQCTTGDAFTVYRFPSYEKNGIVTFNIGLIPSASSIAADVKTEVCTISKAPDSIIYIPAIVFHANLGKALGMANMEINTEGVVSIYSNIQLVKGTHYISASASYMCG